MNSRVTCEALLFNAKSLIENGDREKELRKLRDEVKKDILSALKSTDTYLMENHLTEFQKKLSNHTTRKSYITKLNEKLNEID